jgi:peptidoglycan/LPS O-acetylase OafA/YrhL
MSRRRSPHRVRLFIGAVGFVAFYLGLVVATTSRAYPAIRFPGTVAACVGAALILIAIIRPADRGRS